MASDIKQKIVLEGEKEYSSSLKEAQRNLKTLRSELKAETAELGKNATEQQKAEVRTKNLQKQIAEQEKIVKANASALEEVRAKYADNADAIAKYEQKLNESRAALANMKNELENTGDGFKDLAKDADMATVAAKSISDTIGSLADVGNTVANSIEGIFSGMVSTIEEAFGRVWQLFAETAAKANNWTDLANAYGTTAEQIQRIESALKMSGNKPLSDLMTIIQKVNWSGDKKEKLLTDALGISGVNYTDKLQYTMLVLDKLAELKKTNPAKVDSLYEQVFGGKQATNVSWFIDNWETVQAMLKDYDENGYGQSQETLDTMNEAYVTLTQIEEKWNKLKEKFAGGLGTVTLSIMTNVNGALDALSKYFNAEDKSERDKALDELKENIVSAFTKIKEGIDEGIKALDELAADLQGSDDKTAQALGNILGGIVSVLEWFTEDNMKNVVGALTLLADFWIGAKALGMIGNVTQFASQIAILKGTGGIRALFGLAEKTTSSITTAIAAAAGPIASAIAGITMTVGIASLAVPVLAALKEIILGKWPDWLPDPNAKIGDLVLKGAPEDLKKTAEEVANSGLGTLAGLNNPLGVTILKIAESQAEVEDEIMPTLPTQSTSNGNKTGFDVTEEQKAAAEVWWDVYRMDPVLGSLSEEAEKLMAAFEGQEDIYNALLDMVYWYENHQKDFYEMEDLPSDWWMNSGDSLTGTDARDMASAVRQMPTAVARALNGTRFSVDGQAFASLVVPMVSETIARDMII